MLVGRNCPSLARLTIKENKLKHLEIEAETSDELLLPHLLEVDVSLNKLRNLDSFFGLKNGTKFQHAESLLLAPNLTTLIVKRNGLQIIPNLSRHPKLIRLNLSENMIKNLPELTNEYAEKIYNYLPLSLVNLELDNNQLDVISTDISYMKNVERLDLSANYLSSIPPEIALMEKISYWFCRGIQSFKNGFIQLLK